MVFLLCGALVATLLAGLGTGIAQLSEFEI